MQQKFRKGDAILVPAIVELDYPPARNEASNEVADDRGVYVKVGYQTATFPIADIKLVRPFYKPGETVFVPKSPVGESPYPVQVIAVHDDLVWVKEEDGKTNVFAALDLVRSTEEPAR